MLTVRFASGLSLTYNAAYYIECFDGGWHLYTKKGGSWIATANGDCIIEAEPPCAISSRPLDLAAAIAVVREQMREAGYRDAEALAELKLELKDLNRQTLRWRK